MISPRKFFLILILFCSIFSSSTYAAYGASFVLPLETSTPPYLRGYQVMLNYDPMTLSWNRFSVYFDGGFSRFWVTNNTNNKSLNIYSIAPIVRYSFNKQGPVIPYLEFSIGASYLTKTRLDGRNLGIHFAFQDRAGIGAMWTLQNNQKILMSIKAIHYSNARLSEHNSGITVPLALDIGYQFA